MRNEHSSKNCQQACFMSQVFCVCFSRSVRTQVMNFRRILMFVFEMKILCKEIWKNTHCWLFPYDMFFKWFTFYHFLLSITRESFQSSEILLLWLSPKKITFYAAKVLKTSKKHKIFPRITPAAQGMIKNFTLSIITFPMFSFPEFFRYVNWCLCVSFQAETESLSNVASGSKSNRNKSNKKFLYFFFTFDVW